jgi:hypothetical protein
MLTTVPHQLGIPAQVSSDESWARRTAVATPRRTLRVPLPALRRDARGREPAQQPGALFWLR